MKTMSDIQQFKWDKQLIPPLMVWFFYYAKPAKRIPLFANSIQEVRKRTNISKVFTTIKDLSQVGPPVFSFCKIKWRVNNMIKCFNTFQCLRIGLLKSRSVCAFQKNSVEDCILEYVIEMGEQNKTLNKAGKYLAMIQKYYSIFPLSLKGILSTESVHSIKKEKLEVYVNAIHMHHFIVYTYEDWESFMTQHTAAKGVQRFQTKMVTQTFTFCIV